MTNKIKTLLLLFTLLIPNLSSALIDVKEFKMLCNSSNKEKIANLKQELSQANTDDFQLWISSFDTLYLSPLIYAVYINSIPIIILLIDNCIKHNIIFWEFIDTEGKSLLSIAASKQHIEAVKLLLKYNHPVSMNKANATSALHQAAMNSNIEICKLLIAKNSKLIHCKDVNRMTPINYLMSHNAECDVLNLLDKFPVNKNMIPLDANGRSYLHHAVANYKYEIVHYLLEVGFDYNQKDYFGMTPLNLSRNQEDKTILHILESEKKKHKCCFWLHNILSRSKSEDNNIAFYTSQQNYSYNHID